MALLPVAVILADPAGSQDDTEFQGPKPAGLWGLAQIHLALIPLTVYWTKKFKGQPRLSIQRHCSLVNKGNGAFSDRRIKGGQIEESL